MACRGVRGVPMSSSIASDSRGRRPATSSNDNWPRDFGCTIGGARRCASLHANEVYHVGPRYLHAHRQHVLQEKQIKCANVPALIVIVGSHLDSIARESHIVACNCPSASAGERGKGHVEGHAVQDGIWGSQASRIGMEDDKAGFIPCTKIKDGRDATRGTKDAAHKRNRQSKQARGHPES